jgi:hypothetical protein
VIGKARFLWPWLVAALVSVVIVPVRASLPVLALYVAGATIGLAGLNRVLVAWRPTPSSPPHSEHGRVLVYALPSLVIWTFSWLAFFPALMSPDSVDEWHQATVIPLSDHHPLLHILAERFLSWIWPSPAVVALTQILLLGLLVGWGCQSLRRAGVPRYVVLVISFLCALSLSNVGLSVTLWKDIPYAAGVLALTILLFRFEELNQGAESARFWIGVGVACLLTLTFRHNGLPAVVGAALGFLLLDRRSWKAMLTATLAALVLQSALHSWALHRYHTDAPPTSLALVPLLSAHVAAKTPLTPPEQTLLSTLLPLDQDWAYNCLDTNSTLYHEGFSTAGLRLHDRELLLLAARLWLRAPGTSLRHLACSSSMLWQLFAEGTYLDGPPVWIRPDGQVQSIYPGPDSPTPNSLFPELRVELARLFLSTVHDDSVSWLLWRPALSLYLLVFCCAVACQRRRSWRPAFVLLPCVFHTLVLALAIGHEDLRYQYPVILVGQLFTLGFIFLPAESVTESDRQNEGAAGASFDLSILLVFLCICFVLIAFFPGHVSPDSIWQLKQGRSGIFDDNHPPLMAFVWGALDHYWPGPAPMVVLQNLLFWGGLFGFGIWLSRERAWLVMLFVGFWPSVFALLGTVWKDVQMGAAFMCALAAVLLAGEVRNFGKQLLVLAFALLALFYGTAVRHNGLLPAFPVLVLLVHRSGQLAWRSRGLWIAATAAFFLLVASVGIINRSLTSHHSHLWQQSMVYDLVALSIADDHDDFPKSFWNGKDPISLERMRELYDPSTAVWIYYPHVPGPHFELVTSGRDESEPEALRDLPRSWLAASLGNPLAFAKHRLRMIKDLLGIGGQQTCLAFDDGRGSNDLGIVVQDSWIHRRVMTALQGRSDSLFFRGWAYVLALVLLPLVMWRRRGPLAAVAVTLGASGLLNAVPHFFIGVGCDFRYLWWSVVCALCLAALVIVDVARRGYRRSLPSGASL